MSKEPSVVKDTWKCVCERWDGETTRIAVEGLLLGNEPQEVKDFLLGDRFRRWMTMECRHAMYTFARLMRRVMEDEAERQRNLLKSPQLNKDTQND